MRGARKRRRSRTMSEPRHGGGRSAKRRSVIAAVAAVALLGQVAPSRAGPCTADIAQTEQQLKRLAANPSPSGAGEPTATQSTAAQLHRQPTPAEVQSAQKMARADAAAALERARQADAAGNAGQCAQFLNQARNLYGLQ